MPAKKEEEYGFGQGENVITIVQRTPRGTEIIEAKASELDSLDLVAPGPGVEHEVVPTAPRGDQPVSPGATEVAAPVEVREVPAKDVIDVKAAKVQAAKQDKPAPAKVEEKKEPAKVAAPTAARGRIASDVGPDPKQEAAKTVPVVKPATKKGP